MKINYSYRVNVDESHNFGRKANYKIQHDSIYIKFQNRQN